MDKNELLACAILVNGTFAKEYLATGIDRSLHYSDDNRTPEEFRADMIKISKEADELPDEFKKKYHFFVYCPFMIEYGCRPTADSPFYKMYIECKQPTYEK